MWPYQKDRTASPPATQSVSWQGWDGFWDLQVTKSLSHSFTLLLWFIQDPQAAGTTTTHCEHYMLSYIIILCWPNILHPSSLLLLAKLRHVKNSKHFIELVGTQSLSNKDVMVSCDVTSLFTNVPVPDALDYLRQWRKQKSRPLISNLRVRMRIRGKIRKKYSTKIFVNC